jgi:hypothetical protein
MDLTHISGSILPSVAVPWSTASVAAQSAAHGQPGGFPHLSDRVSSLDRNSLPAVVDDMTKHTVYFTRPSLGNIRALRGFDSRHVVEGPENATSPGRFWQYRPFAVDLASRLVHVEITRPGRFTHAERGRPSKRVLVGQAACCSRHGASAPELAGNCLLRQRRVAWANQSGAGRSSRGSPVPHPPRTEHTANTTRFGKAVDPLASSPKFRLGAGICMILDARFATGRGRRVHVGNQWNRYVEQVNCTNAYERKDCGFLFKTVNRIVHAAMHSLCQNSDCTFLLSSGSGVGMTHIKCMPMYLPDRQRPHHRVPVALKLSFTIYYCLAPREAQRGGDLGAGGRRPQFSL